MTASPEEFEAISKKVRFLCDVLATAKLGEIPSSIPAIEAPEDIERFNKNELVLQLVQFVNGVAQQVVVLRAAPPHLLEKASLDRKHKYLEGLAVTLRESRE